VLTLQPMMPADFSSFFEAASESYANDNVASGRWNEADALDLAREETKRLLPQEERTADNSLFVLLDTERSTTVGYLWYATLTRGSKKVAFLFLFFLYASSTVAKAMACRLCAPSSLKHSVLGITHWL